MKLLLILLTAFLLVSCQTESPGTQTPNEPLSNETSILSLDITVAQVYDGLIYINEALTISELMQVLVSIDNSQQTYRATANDGTTKTRDKLFQYDEIEVTSESGQYTKTYSIRYFD